MPKGRLISEPMTPDHPLWDTFCGRLDGPEGCNIREVRGPKKLTWRCDRKRYTSAILSTIPGINVRKSFAYFARHGGDCDCEILFNVVMKFGPS